MFNLICWKQLKRINVRLPVVCWPFWLWSCTRIVSNEWPNGLYKNQPHLTCHRFICHFASFLLFLKNLFCLNFQINKFFFFQSLFQKCQKIIFKCVFCYQYFLFPWWPLHLHSSATLAMAFIHRVYRTIILMAGGVATQVTVVIGHIILPASTVNYVIFHLINFIF